MEPTTRVPSARQIEPALTNEGGLELLISLELKAEAPSRGGSRRAMADRISGTTSSYRTLLYTRSITSTDF